MTPQGIPIQPVDDPILCSPYGEPKAHWLYNNQTGEPQRIDGRRPASYFYKSDRSSGTAQLSMLAEETRDDLPLVNALREDVRRWRESKWENATETTKTLLRHWWREDRARRLFFCQLEAVETVIYLREILAQGKRTRWKQALPQGDYALLAAGQNPRPDVWNPVVAQPPRLADGPENDPAALLARYACKMATGSGKTVVMAMLIAWAFCNRGRVPGAAHFPKATLVVCPNLTIKERLQVLRPSDARNYYDAFDLVPSALRAELSKGKVLVTNWHAFNPESEHSEGGKSYMVVNKGAESPEAFARARLGDLYDGEPILVLNDEGHHAYRPRPLPKDAKLKRDDEEERKEATVWVSGLDKIRAACGVRFVVDLSATPFYIGSSGYPEGSPFPWIVSDFGLVDAIESGITKIPRLPTQDNTGRPVPRFFKLWEEIVTRLKPGDRLPGGKPKPDAVWREAQAALTTLASQWKERYEASQESAPGQSRVPPVLIIVCDNTDLALHFHEKISGQRLVDVDAELDEADADGDDEGDGDEAEATPAAKRGKDKRRVVYGNGEIFPDLLSNSPGREVTIRIDSNLLAEAEAGRADTSRDKAAQALRQIVATVGKPGEPGEHVRCVVSVNMLSEGWDANNVTHILGLRAFGSQLLCEQVVGRGLRRMDYTVGNAQDERPGMLSPEYVDIFGVPFSLIPYKGREAGASTKNDDRQPNEVLALKERAGFEIRFPIVERYAVALSRNLVRCDVSKVERTRVDPAEVPTAAFLQATVGIMSGPPSAYGGFAFERVDRSAYHASVHPQTIEFAITLDVVRGLTDSQPRLRAQSRAALFPQVLRIVQEYIRTRVDNPVHPAEIGLEKYALRIRDMLLSAIEPDGGGGEPPLLPILNRYQRTGSTAAVRFKTVRPVQAAQKSHLNYVACDTQSWEQAAMFQLESSPYVRCYARNDHLEFNIPYEFEGNPQVYEPDFIVQLTRGTRRVNLILEVKGLVRADTNLKHEAAKRWVKAVNNAREFGAWDFMVCHEPQELGRMIAGYAEGTM